MEDILKTTVVGLFFGTFGTTLGGIIGIIIKKQSNKFLSFILSFASGLMMSIVCFELIPESMGISSIQNTIVAVILGIITMLLCDIVVENKFSYKKGNSLLKTKTCAFVWLVISLDLSQK